MGTHLIIRKEEAGQQVRGLSWKEKRPRSSTPMRCSCSYGRGIPRIIMKKQLQAFYYSLITQGMKKDHCPEDWLEAFFMLEMHLQNINDGARQVIFFDELPWMDTPKSGFITGFEAFWNGWACHRNVMLIVAGSVTSSGFRIN